MKRSLNKKSPERCNKKLEQVEHDANCRNTVQKLTAEDGGNVAELSWQDVNGSPRDKQQMMVEMAESPNDAAELVEV